MCRAATKQQQRRIKIFEKASCILALHSKRVPHTQQTIIHVPSQHILQPGANQMRTLKASQ